MAKKMIECPKCHGTGDQGDWFPQMTPYGYDDGTEMCERCRGKCKVAIQAKPTKHIEHSSAPMAVAGAATYSIMSQE